MTITWGRDGTEAFVAVLDEGPGISPEDAAAAFERFRRGAARPAGRRRNGPRASRSWARSPRAGAAPRRSRAAPRAAPERRSGCRRRPSGQRSAQHCRRPTRGTLAAEMRIRLTAVVLGLAGLLVAVAVGPRGELDRDPIVHARRRCAALGRAAWRRRRRLAGSRHGDDRAGHDAGEDDDGGDRSRSRSRSPSPRRTHRHDDLEHRRRTTTAAASAAGAAAAAVAVAAAAARAAARAISGRPRRRPRRATTSETLTDSWGAAYQRANRSDDRLDPVNRTRESS